MSDLIRIAVLLVTLGAYGCGQDPCTGGEDPQGVACESATECSRNCVCENGEEISVGICTNGVCEGVTTACAQQCTEYEFGAYTGQFCAAREIR